MARILVTGAGGYIGSVLTAKLLEKGHTVIALDRFFFGQDTLAGLSPGNRLVVMREDIRDVTPRLFEGVDAVIDLAALSNDPSGNLDPGLTESINHKGRVNVAKCAKAAGVGRYILSSSCSVYGCGDQQMLDESAKTNPITAYAKANLLAEEGTLPLSSNGFTCTAIRNATVFGLSRRMRFDLVINLMTLHAVQKGKVVVMGGGKQWRPLVHVRDVAGAFLAVLEAPRQQVGGHVFNIGNENHQVLTIAYLVRETLPFRIDIEIAPDDADRRDYKVSFEKIRTVLNFTPNVGIVDGIKEVYDALKLGRVHTGPETSTVGWYRSIIDAEKLISRVKLNDRLM